MNQANLFSPPPGVPCPTCNGTGTIPEARLQELRDAPGKVGRGHPTTSRTAGTTPQKGTQRHKVMRILYRQGDGTAYELAAALGKSPNQCATRLQELREDTFVEYARDPETREILERPTTPGNTGLVQQLTSAGVRVLFELESRK